MRTIQPQPFKVYKFEELTPEQQERALGRHRDINVDYEWWDYTCDDADTIGLTIEAFDTGRANSIQTKPQENAFVVATNIIKHHGEKCETFALAEQLIANTASEDDYYEVGEGELHQKDEDWECHYEEEFEEFFRELGEEYLSILKKEYGYLMEDEQIKETLISNDYDFTTDGEIYT